MPQRQGDVTTAMACTLRVWPNHQLAPAAAAVPKELTSGQSNLHVAPVARTVRWSSQMKRRPAPPPAVRMRARGSRVPPPLPSPAACKPPIADNLNAVTLTLVAQLEWGGSRSNLQHLCVMNNCQFGMVRSSSYTAVSQWQPLRTIHRWQLNWHRFSSWTHGPVPHGLPTDPGCCGCWTQFHGRHLGVR